MKKSIFLFMILSFCFYKNIKAQNNFWSSSEAYLGQIPPSDTPKIFAPGLLGDASSFSLDRVAFSPDGKEFYYCTNDEWFSEKNLKIKRFKYDRNKWNGPTLLNEHFYAPTFSKDGNSLYFMGGKSIGEVWQSHRMDTGWSIPALYIKKNYAMYDYMPTNSGISYVGSNANNGSINDFSSYDICRFSVSNNDTTIQSLGIPLNTPGFNGDFFVSKDESFIIISAKEHPDFECELYISYRKKDNTWTNPKSLGQLINNGLAHRWGEYVTPDNRYLFYSYGHSKADCKILWVRFDKLLESLKHTNFDPYVKSAIKNRSVFVHQSFRLKISENTFVDDDGNNTLTWSASSNNGIILPSWLKFDAKKKTFSGTPLEIGTYNIKVTVIDPAKATASTSFLLIVNK